MITTLIFAAALGYSSIRTWSHLIHPIGVQGPPSIASDPPGWGSKVLAIGGGILGGYIAYTVFGSDQLAANGLAGFATGRIVSDLLEGLIKK